MGRGVAKALAIARTNLTRFLRDRSNYFFVFLFPIGLILIFGLTFGGEGGVTVGVSAGQEPLAQRFVAALAARPGVAVKLYSDEDELRDRVERGDLTAGVVVPPGLQARLEAGEVPQLAFMASGAGAQYQMLVASALDEVAESLRAARLVASRTGSTLADALTLVDAAAAEGQGVTVTREWVGGGAFGDDVQTFDVGAGSQLVLFVFLTGLTSASALIQSRKFGVSRRMLGSPTSAVTIVVGEALGRYVVALFQGAYIMLATRLAFGVDWGDTLGALALLVVFSAVAAGAAMLLGSLFSSDQAAGGVSIMLGLGLAALGGCMVPLEIFGPTMRQVARFVPHSWAVEGYAALLRHGRGLMDVLPNLAVLTLFAVALFALAAWRFRARLLEGA